MTRSGEPLDEVVELRVHGVHGTSPASMLGVEAGDVRQVAGDNLTGCYRSKSGELPYRRLEGLPVSVEAYSWGTLTSGVRGLFGWVQRALWLLLLPFALANLAYWARLELDGKTRASRRGARYTRLGALLLTVFMVLIPSMVGINLVAWQCYRGDSPGCERLPGLLEFMADASASQRLAVGSLLPLAFVAVLWFLSRQSLLRYEEVEYAGDEPTDDHTLVLRHPKLWSGLDRTGQLQRVHLTIALLVVTGFSGYHVVNHQVGGSDLLLVTLLPAAALAALATLWALSLHPDDVEYDGARATRLGRYLDSARYRDLHRRLPGLLLGAACVTTALHLVLLWYLPGDLKQQADFVGDNTWFISVFVSLTVAHLALFTGERMGPWSSFLVVLLVAALGAAAVIVHLKELEVGSVAGQLAIVGVVGGVLAALGVWQVKAGRRHQDKAWNGAGPSVMLAAAAWIALLFTTGAVTATANYLNGADHGVDDLVSRLDTEHSIATEAVVDAAEGAELAATGDVLVRDAVITLDGRDPVLRSGQVESERLYDVTEEVVEKLEDVALQKGRTRLERGTVVLDADRVRVQDSCIRLKVTGPCSPESSRFLVGGLLQLPPPPSSDPDRAPRLKIISSGGVELTPSSPPAVPLVVPQVLIWAPLMQTLWLVASALWLLVAVLLFRRSHPAIAALTRAEIDVRDQVDCLKARRRAAFAHRAERLLDGIGAITSVVAVALIGLSASGEAPWDKWEFLRPFATLGMYVALGLGLGIVLLSSRIRSSEGTRKAVGILWDLTTFWPRAAHPLAPPCYAERVVPELRTRVGWALHSRQDPDPRAGNRIVLSGHSQGSVIVCALVSRLPAADLARTRVITYGSQIRALYGRIFPAVFGPAQIGYEETPGMTRLSHPAPDAPAEGAVPVDPSAVPMWRTRPDSLVARFVRHGGEWVNLFRRSDPLGFRVFSDHDLEPDRYVPEVPDVIVGDAGPQVNTHGGYQHTLVYRTAVAEWTGETVQRDPVTTTNIPALPV